MRAPFVVMMLALGVAACGPTVPESGAGFQDYNSYIRNSTAQPNPAPQGAPAASTGFSTDSVAAAIDSAQQGSAGAPAGAAPLDPAGLIPQAGATAAQPYANPQAPAAGQSGASQSGTGHLIPDHTADGQTGAPQAGMQTGVQTGVQTGAQAATATSPAALPPIDSSACAGRGNAFAGIKETTSEMNYASGGVSDEQDFKAVTGRETIASDKQRIECNREQYVVVQPGALPVRPGDEGPNIAAFALATNNPPGVKLYRRPPFYLTNPEKACAKYASPDLAQQAFLASGGPQRDPKALDPDGDGFACAWDPRPFRKAKQ
ncbi:hypothetical protein GC209_10380 [bacterium]|nr:hypothetical protein [bacterium]